MNINHHNYESWLLQYVDNELTVAEREAVEAFVAENPEASDLLEDFKQVVLQPDLSLFMPGKAQLLQPELWEPTSISKQQESLLLLADEALPDAEKATLLEKIQKSPLLQKEWNLLSKTILSKESPEEMPGKDRIFRYPKVFPIAYRRMLRIAVAAAIFGIGLFLADQFLENIEVAPGAEIVQNTTPKRDPAPKSTPQKGLEKKTDDVEENNPESVSVLAGTANQSIAGKNKKQPEQPEQKPVIVIPEKRMVQQEMPEQVLMAAVIPETDHPKNRETLLPHLNSTFQGVESNTDIAASIPDADHYASPAVEAEYEYTTTETILANEYSEEEETINIAGARFNKQKLRNVYRNVTRPISRAFNRSTDEKSGGK